MAATVSLARRLADVRHRLTPATKQYAAILALPKWQPMLTDCVHPDDALFAIKDKNEATAIGPLVRSLTEGR
jgi:hypothetical protein